MPITAKPNNLPVPPKFEVAIERFVRIQEGRNRSPQTLRAYRSDLSQLAGWLHEDNALLTDPIDVNEFLASLAHRNVSGTSRARKLAVIREFYRSLKNSGLIVSSPVDAVETPKCERKSRTYLTPGEYNRLLAAAGANSRDFCILTLFIQTGIRISELCELRPGDIDLDLGLLTVRIGKCMAARSIELEKKVSGPPRSGWRCVHQFPTITCFSTGMKNLLRNGVHAIY